MSNLVTIPLPRRTELVLRPPDAAGRQVVKDPLTGAAVLLGEQESFLFRCLDGEQSSRDICEAFERRFGESLSGADLQEFIDLAQGEGFLQPAAPPESDPVGQHN